ncbi:hypothetical protein [Piscinibacter koreensis]|uniref:DUF7822 domain-containing protein n=1 Tax=Piscinibacter koreensis TaxID=2742824 RepID=A0A7Y6TX18_9BURK|nr:hypothetical protein [Schlegelella koreensis]NUZ06632.1 hypothetical protein [Schlegelella koreensis]
MANRSYLYATDSNPGDGPDFGRLPVGLAEWAYDFPLAFKILVSEQARPCKSIIWKVPGDDIAIIGNYRLGFERLKKFLHQIDLPAAQPLIDDTLRFLTRPENRREFIVLEGGELFDMGEEPMAELNARLFIEVSHLEPEIDSVLERLRWRPPAPRREGLLGRLFAPKPAPLHHDDQLKLLRQLGLGAWSNALHVDFSQG